MSSSSGRMLRVFPIHTDFHAHTSRTMGWVGHKFKDLPKSRHCKRFFSKTPFGPTWVPQGAVGLRKKRATFESISAQDSRSVRKHWQEKVDAILDISFEKSMDWRVLVSSSVSSQACKHFSFLLTGLQSFRLRNVILQWRNPKPKCERKSESVLLRVPSN